MNLTTHFSTKYHGNNKLSQPISSNDNNNEDLVELNSPTKLSLRKRKNGNLSDENATNPKLSPLLNTE